MEGGSRSLELALGQNGSQWYEKELGMGKGQGRYSLWQAASGAFSSCR